MKSGSTDQPRDHPCPGAQRHTSSRFLQCSNCRRVPEPNDLVSSSCQADKGRAEESRSPRTTFLGAVFAGTLALSVVAASIATSASAQSAADPQAAGRAVFQQKCQACHSLSPSENGRGPTLYRLFGRMAGTVSGYFYSAGMRGKHVVWTAATLQRYLADPREFIPGTTMTFAGIKDRQDMKNLLAYLRQATR